MCTQALRRRPQPSRPRTASLLCAAALAIGSVGCIGFQAVNEPIEAYDPDYGYRASGRPDRGEIMVYLAFSGGGTRAAALAYGVMQALHETLAAPGETPRTLLEEVDTISSVSGGSFPAAYYGLFGDRIFDEFESRFLRRNIQAGIVWRALIPWNLVALATPWLSRSDLAQGIYHESIFERASFQTLDDTDGPVVLINATDLSSGERFMFTQGDFDLICSDVHELSIAYAVAASSAVPLLLSPISMRNHAGRCGFEPPPWLEEALDSRLENPRRYRSARAWMGLHDPNKQYLHLIDGGISDNLGLRAGIDIIQIAGSLQRAAELMNSDPFDKMLVISVNAETDPDPTIDVSSAAPGFANLMNAVSGGQIRRYNFETLVLMQTLLEQMEEDARRTGDRLETYLVDVSLENFDHESDRRYFKRIPTSFQLRDRQVDELIWAGRELLLDSPEYRELLRDIGGTPAQKTPRPGRD